MSRRAFLAAACAIVLIAVGLRAYHAAGRDSIWGDEAQELGIVRASGSVGELLEILRQEGHPPLHYLIEWGLFRAGGETLVMARPHLVAYGTLAVALAMLLAYRCFGPRCALLTGLLAAVSPFFIAYSTELRNYALFAAVAPLFGLAYVRLLDRRDMASALAWGAAGALLSLTHYFGLFAVVSSGLFVLWQDRSRGGWLRIVAASGAFGLVFAPWIPSFLWQLTVDLQPWGRTRTDPRLILHVLTAPLGRTAAIAGGIGLVLGVLHVRRPERPAHERNAFFGLIFASVGATVIAFVAQISRGSFQSRYLIAYAFLLLPAVCLYPSRMGSLGDVVVWRGPKTGRPFRLPRRWHARAGLGLALLAVLGYGTEWRYWVARRVDATAHSAELIAVQERSGDLVVVSPAWTMLTFAYHYSGSLPVCAPPYGKPQPWMDHLARLERTADREATGRQIEALAERLRHGGRVWLVARHPLPVDAEALARFGGPRADEAPLVREEILTHCGLLAALCREGVVGFRWASRWDDFRFNVVLLRFDPRPEAD